MIVTAQRPELRLLHRVIVTAQRPELRLLHRVIVTAQRPELRLLHRVIVTAQRPELRLLHRVIVTAQRPELRLFLLTGARIYLEKKCSLAHPWPVLAILVWLDNEQPVKGNAWLPRDSKKKELKNKIKNSIKS